MAPIFKCSPNFYQCIHIKCIFVHFKSFSGTGNHILPVLFLYTAVVACPYGVLILKQKPLLNRCV